MPSVYSGVAPRFIIAGGQQNKGSNNLNFQPLGAAAASSTSEAILAVIDVAFEIQRHRVAVGGNGKDAATTFHVRDDTSSVTTVSVAAATTGAFDSGALTVSVASGSQVGFACDTTGSTTGTIAFAEIATCEAE